MLSRSASTRAVVREQLERLDASDSDLAELAAEVSGLRGGLATARTEAEELTRLLTAKDRSLAELQGERDDVRRHAQATSASLREARTLLEARQANVESLEREGELLQAELAVTHRRISALQAELAEARAPVEEPGAPEPREIGHVRFLGGPSGYALTSSTDACPGPGDVLETDGASYVTVRVGRSPLPGDARPCAFLMRQEPARS